MAESVQISYIVPVYNGASTLEHCLRAIASQYDQASREIIIIDNGSTDDSRALATRFAQSVPGTVLLEEHVRGPAAARNRGIAQASGRYLAFIDCDVVLDLNWEQTCRAEFQTPWIDCVQSPIIPSDTQPKSRALRFRRAFISNKTQGTFSYLPRVARGLPTLNSAAFMIRREKLREGPCAFEPSLPRCEDADLTYQLLFSGCHFSLSLETHARVFDNRSMVAYLRRSFLTAYHDARVCALWTFRRAPDPRLTRTVFSPLYSTRCLLAIHRIIAAIGARSYEVRSAVIRKEPTESKLRRFQSRDLRNSFLLRVGGRTLSPWVRIFKLARAIVVFNARSGTSEVLSANESHLFLSWVDCTLKTGACEARSNVETTLLARLVRANVLVEEPS